MAIAGRRSINPANAFSDMAHWMDTAEATAPISTAPKGVPAPIQTLKRPIIRPRMSWGVASIVTALCIVEKPDWAIPLKVSSPNVSAYQGDQTTIIPISKTPVEPSTKTRPW